MNPDTNHPVPTPPTNPSSGRRSLLSLVAVTLGLILAVFLLTSPRSEPVKRLASSSIQNGAATSSGCTRYLAANQTPAAGSGCCGPTAPMGLAGSPGACEMRPAPLNNTDANTKATPSGVPHE